MEHLQLKIVLILTVGFALASILGYIAHRIKLSPIFGYLIAGYIIGPYSPGFVADREISEQLAEIGVILMMFGVGLHFKWRDLLHVKNIAILGAVTQTVVAAAIGAMLTYSMGWSLEAGIIFGLAIGVASTMVLVRVLSDNNLLHTPQGLISVGWLIVEDIITVAVLLLLPVLSCLLKGEGVSIYNITFSVVLIIFKFIVLISILFTVGRKCVVYILSKVIETKSQELFILTVLALTFVIAIGSALVFGTSIALGAFIAGMVIGQTQSKVRQQASSNAMPLKDAFVVIFFLSVGMLFNPQVILANFPTFLGVFAIIILAKPLTAFFITLLAKYPMRTALTVSIALAQIGEFSFILAEEAIKFRILPYEGYDILVACSLVSISINPLLFKLLKKRTRST